MKLLCLPCLIDFERNICAYFNVTCDNYQETHENVCTSGEEGTSVKHSNLAGVHSQAQELGTMWLQTQTSELHNETGNVGLPHFDWVSMWSAQFSRLILMMVSKVSRVSAHHSQYMFMWQGETAPASEHNICDINHRIKCWCVQDKHKSKCQLIFLANNNFRYNYGGTTSLCSVQYTSDW